MPSTHKLLHPVKKYVSVESVKRDLKDWSITKKLALVRREWKLAIHVPKP
jgi:hypothetical protein